jgi:hypothetical protein
MLLNLYKWYNLFLAANGFPPDKFILTNPNTGETFNVPGQIAPGIATAAGVLA